jgi:hypothetical protein
VPFTLAHPVAVWPLSRWRALQLLPLLMGSVAPDLPDYMPGVLAGHFEDTHTVPGSVTQDLPLGLVALVAVVVLRGPLTQLAGPRAGPLFHDALSRFARTPRLWILAPVSVFAGIWTHLLWDSFTHEEGWMVPYIPWLSRSVTVLGHTSEMAHLLQYVSSVAGLVLLLVWYRSCVSALPASSKARPEDRSRAQVLAGVAVAALIIGVAHALGPAHGQAIYRVASLLLTRTIAWFGLLYLAAGTVMSLLHRKSARMAPEAHAPGP